jgi:hypothetical protein
VNKPQFVSSRTPRAIERAMWLVEGEAFDVEAPMGLTPGPGTVTTAWKAHDRASKALVKYLNLAKDLDGPELQRLVAAAKEPKGVAWNQPAKPGWWNDLAWWKGRLQTDWAVRDLYDFQAEGHHGMAEKTGYMDLHQALVEELVNAGLLWGGQYAGAKDIMHFDLQGQITRPR